MKYCTNCGNKLADNQTFCNKCGKKIEPKQDDKKEIGAKVKNEVIKENHNKKSNKALIGVMIGVLVVIGGVYLCFKYEPVKNIIASKFKEDKKLDISIQKINLNNYPWVEILIIKENESSVFSKGNINLYDGDRNIEDFNLKTTNGGWILTYETTDIDPSKEESEVKIENKMDIKDVIEKNYIKPQQQVAKTVEIKPAENTIDVKKEVNKIDGDSIKNIALNEFKNIKGGYSFEFKDLSQQDAIRINNEKTISASTIKLFVMIEIMSQIKENKIGENDTVVLEDNMKVDGSGVLRDTKAGQQFTISKLIELMMTKSDNTAANILIDKAGTNNINRRITSLGCVNTELNRKMMDQAAINKGIQNYTSVSDLCLTLTKLYNGQCVDANYDTKMINIMKRNESRSKLPSGVPSGVEVANKSGEYTGVENDAGIIFTSKGAYILCITTRDGESGNQVRAISNISKKIYEEYMKSK